MGHQIEDEIREDLRRESLLELLAFQNELFLRLSKEPDRDTRIILNVLREELEEKLK